MKKMLRFIPATLLGALAMAWFLSSSAPAEAQAELKEFPIAISATDVNTNTSVGFTARKIWIHNDLNSANEVYVTLVSGVSTTSKVRLDPGQGLALDNAYVVRFGVICATGETATVYGGAWR